MFRVVLLLVILVLQAASVLPYVLETNDHNYGPTSRPGPDASRAYDCEDLKSPDPVEIAYGIKHCLDLPLHTELRVALRQLKEDLPESVRNSVFLDETCIVNKKYGEFMFSPDDGFKYEGQSTQRRRVFTWIGDAWYHKGKGDWKLIHHEDETFFIVSVEYGEFLTVNADVVKNRRPVSTIHASPSWLEENQSRALWTLEPLRDFMHIKNVHTKEYLFAVNGANYDATKRTVSTWTGAASSCTRYDQCVWSIKPC